MVIQGKWRQIITGMAVLGAMLIVPVQGEALTWQTVGPPIVTERWMGYPDVAAGSSGKVYLSYSSSDGQQVHQYGMEQWNLLKSNGFLSYSRPSITVDSSGKLYAAGMIPGTDGFCFTNLAVKRLSTQAWSTVGKESFSPFYQAGDPCVAFDPQGTPYVLFAVPADFPNPPTKPVNYNAAYYCKEGPYGRTWDVFKLSLMKFDGKGWVQVGDPVFTDWYNARFLNMVFDKNGKLYVAFDEQNVNIGLEAFQDPENTQKLHTYGTFQNRVTVMTYTPGSGWARLGDALEDVEIGKYAPRQVVLALSPEGTPWIAYQGKRKVRDDSGSYGNVYENRYSLWVKVFEEGVWKDTFSEESMITTWEDMNLRPLSLAFDWNGMPWLSYQYDVTEHFGLRTLETGRPALKRCVMMDGRYVWTDVKPGGAEGMTDAVGLEVVSDPEGSLYLAAFRKNSAAVWRAYEISDVPEQAWYREAVSYLIDHGISAGTDSTHFSPEATLTRGQFLTMAMRAYGLKPEAAPAENFTDAGNTYYTGYLATARTLGITQGVGKNTFAPERVITRQEMMVLLYGVLRAADRVPEKAIPMTLKEFQDADRVAPWAQDAMGRFVSAGTLHGYAGELRPFGTATRAELAQVLYSLLKE